MFFGKEMFMYPLLKYTFLIDFLVLEPRAFQTWLRLMSSPALLRCSSSFPGVTSGRIPTYWDPFATWGVPSMCSCLANGGRLSLGHFLRTKTTQRWMLNPFFFHQLLFLNWWIPVHSRTRPKRVFWRPKRVNTRPNRMRPSVQNRPGPFLKNEPFFSVQGFTVIGLTTMICSSLLGYVIFP